MEQKTDSLIMKKNNRKYGLEKTLNYKETKVLILGTFPSEESLASGEYYRKKSNRFWDVIFLAIEEEKPEKYKDRIKVLNYYGICLWDLIKSCERNGSLDKNIHNAIKNDFSSFKNVKVLINGFSTRKKYTKYGLKKSDLDGYIFLPSTSKANTKYKQKRLVREWKKSIINS